MPRAEVDVQDEAALLAAWRAGDAAAGQRLFGRTYAVVSRYFRNKVAASVHADLVQKTFLACLRAALPLRDMSSFRAYLLRAAHHTLVDHFREQQRGEARGLGGEQDVDEIVVADSVADPDVLVARREEHRILLAALRRLPFALQVVLELRYWESLTDREIADVLGAPLGTVKTRLRDGHDRLRRALAAAAASPERIRSTLDTLDHWSERVRDSAGVRDEV